MSARRRIDIPATLDAEAADIGEQCAAWGFEAPPPAMEAAQ